MENEDNYGIYLKWAMHGKHPALPGSTFPAHNPPPSTQHIYTHLNTALGCFENALQILQSHCREFWPEGAGPEDQV